MQGGSLLALGQLFRDRRVYHRRRKQLNQATGSSCAEVG